ncbi:hypothetical protein DFJ74DRAFT_711308 [Hyaloraphidium curvatum]|nr:hypothetical protein DFJ74DRAFT_711308 [Hyaloraphidium curvatum]
MGWAARHIAALLRGETVRFRPRGSSMVPKIRIGQLVEVAPLPPGATPARGDIVLCRVGAAEYLHLVSAVRGDRVQISNNRGRVNGWTGRDRIYGMLLSVED